MPGQAGVPTAQRRAAHWRAHLLALLCAGLLLGLRADAARPDDGRRPSEGDVPLRRFGEPLEFARPAVFLLSPRRAT
jgi:NAD(P)-dependent dehydrogenase (short-subunit alcohol dehydrogenase family)